MYWLPRKAAASCLIPLKLLYGQEVAVDGELSE